jgi:dTDP-4-amino-4,6-dideoxygalactose transaminase
MDGIQGVVLSVKLRVLESSNEARRRHAQHYRKALGGLESFILPVEAPYARHVYHVFAVRVRQRDELLKSLADRGIACGIHYPVPVHLQKAYEGLKLEEGSFPVAEQCAKEFLSLPMFPDLTNDHLKTVIDEVKSNWSQIQKTELCAV